jgi:hypothetical protein
VNLASVALWGFVATIALSAIMSAAQGMGYSRISMPFILGTMFTPSRDRAGVIGFLAHVLSGWLFALLYALLFEAWHLASWWLGAVVGLAHGLVVLLVFLPLLPGVHPRMASERRGPEPTRALEPPGFLALHYGRRTPLVTLVAHLVYGAILGGGYRLVG